MDQSILTDLLIIFSLSVIVVFLFHRLKLPTVVGFLLTGILAGPHGFKLIKGIENVEMLSEVGIVLLLFTIGIEFSLRSMWQIRKKILYGGSLQVLLTATITAFVVYGLGLRLGEAIFIGFLFSLSSSAIVLKLLQESGEIDTQHGKISLGILIFQDVIIIPMILITPLLAGASFNFNKAFFIDLIQGILIIVLVIANAKWVVPKLLYQIAKTKDRELFLICTVLICLAVAWLTSSYGLSLALGAFLAGLVISESEYSHHALSSVLPFKDIFTSMFFISVGMLLDTSFFLEQPTIIISAAMALMLLKLAISSIASAFLGYTFRTNILVGFSLCQIGEFSFVLAKVGLKYELLNQDIYQIFLSISILSMALTPLMMKYAPEVILLARKLSIDKNSESKKADKNYKNKEIKDHLIIVGYGLVGRNLSKVAKTNDIPYLIVDSNPETVRLEKNKRENIFFGDATKESVLLEAGINDARVLIVSTNDLYSTNLITKLARHLNPLIHIIVRTKYFQQTDIFKKLGANEVISEEIQSSMEISKRVLTQFHVEEEKINSFMDEIYLEAYKKI